MINSSSKIKKTCLWGGRCDRMLVGSITTCAISAYHF